MSRRKRLAVAVIGALLIAAALSSFIHRGACAYYGYQTDRATRYAVFVGCMVKVSGGWVPRNELRVVQ